MVENPGIDSALRDAFTTAAETGDGTGVADAIRLRIAAGDVGTSVAGGTAPGFHGGWLSVLPWIGVVVVAGLVGGGLGASGMFGSPTDDVAVVGYTSVLKEQATTAWCPGGPVAGKLDSGTRVLAMERSTDGQHLGVRNPADFSSILWLSAAAVTIDAGQPGSSSLPVGDKCPEVTVTRPTPSAKPKPKQPAPPVPPKNPTTPIKPPAPAKDTTRPTIGTPAASSNPVLNRQPTTISVSASDNKGVTGVHISWLGQYVGSNSMTKSGSKWVYTFTPPSEADGSILFRMVARDAAGNISTTAEITVQHKLDFG